MDSRKERVLVVEDNTLNRQILTELLSPYYEVLAAEDGAKALELLDAQAETISAMLLDLVMPVMDGYQVLQEMKSRSYASLPVIVLTGNMDAAVEEQVLEAGACDFVSKPYHTAVLLSRLKNAIARSQVRHMRELRHVAEHDPLTDLYNQRHFFAAARQMLQENPGTEFVLACVDIDRFQILRSMWGEAGCDRFVLYVADLLRQIMDRFRLCRICRVETATFAICSEYDRSQFNDAVTFLIRELAGYDSNCLIEPSIGVCRITDRDTPVETAYLHASIAMRQCSGKYMDYVCHYQPSMSEALIREQNILDEMEGALEGGQFLVYLQPKYNLQTNTPYGAEALVRWRHPEKGMISPGEFIPVFEKNGFVGKLDAFVWENVCQTLRRWTDEGRDPAPISVNMSRADLYNPNLVDTISSLVQRYGLQPALLNLELTESTYMDNPKLMGEKVQKLRALGFSVMLDDFGSGYSSLNMLKDIQVDYLKIDMKFIQGSRDNTRSERVMASVIRMAGWLELPVIVEGVETREQYDFLQSIGCGYIQGYYFARPMSIPDYENLVGGVKPVPFATRADLRPGVLNAIWSSNEELNYLLDMLPQPMAIYEFEQSSFNLLRTNTAFTRAFGYSQSAEGRRTPYTEHLAPAACQRILSAFWEAVNAQETIQCDYTRTNSLGDVESYRMYLKYLGKTENAYILVASFVRTESREVINTENALPVTRASDGKLGADDIAMGIPALRAGVAFMSGLFDVARVVDPADCAVISFNEDGTMNKKKYGCFLAWGKSARCETCTSHRAMETGQRQIKYELFGDQPFAVLSAPVTLSVNGNSYRLVVEAINQITQKDMGAEAKDMLMSASLNSLIYKDELTKTYNRRYLSRLTTRELDTVLKEKKLALLMVDIHRFKTINDNYGHLTGDLVLEQTAQVLTSHVRANDRVIRLGGDEFLVILTGCDGKAAEAKATELKKAAGAVCYSMQDKKHLGIDIGIAATDAFDQREETFHALLDQADMRMYQDKKNTTEQGDGE